MKNNFSNLVIKLADICRNAVLPENSKLMEKIRHFERFKNLFSWILGLGIELTYKQVFDPITITQPLQVRLDVFAVFL